MPVECEPYLEDLSALIDGELPEESQAEVRAHVDSCESCTARVAALCQVDLALAELPVHEPSEDLRTRLQARIESAAEESTVPARPAVGRAPARRSPPARRRRFALPALGSALAAAAALALYLALPEPEAPLLGLPPTPEPPFEVARDPQPAPPPTPLPDVRPEPGTPTELAPGANDLARGVDFASEEELALAMDLGTVEDLDLIANLELLEQLIAAEGAG